MSEHQMQHYGRNIQQKPILFFPLLSRFSCQQNPPLATKTSSLIHCLRASSAIVQSVTATRKKKIYVGDSNSLLLRLWKHKRTKTTVDSPKRRDDDTPRINDDDDEEKGYFRTTAATTHDSRKRKTVSSKEEAP
jgi:hypothetical protein